MRSRAGFERRALATRNAIPSRNTVAMLTLATAPGCAGDKSAKPRRDYEFATTQPTYNQLGNAVWSTSRSRGSVIAQAAS